MFLCHERSITAASILMEKMLNYKMEDLEDYYGLLGCDELSTVRFIFAIALVIFKETVMA